MGEVSSGAMNKKEHFFPSVETGKRRERERPCVYFPNRSTEGLGKNNRLLIQEGTGWGMVMREELEIFVLFD